MFVLSCDMVPPFSEGGVWKSVICFLKVYEARISIPIIKSVLLYTSVYLKKK